MQNVVREGFDRIGLAVCNFCHNASGEYVLGFRSEKCRDEHLTWEPAGSGGLKFGEKIEDAVRREIREELGAEALEIKFLGVHEAMRRLDGQGTHWLYLVHKVLVDEGAVRINEPDKCLRLGWFATRNFPHPLMSQFAPLLERFKGVL